MKIPATVITGFLGAGKTTLIRHLLENANGRRIALVINEFGDLGIDREIVNGCAIEGCNDDDVVELANGCICCTVADEFLPVIGQLLERENPPDHIVIETSGLALPKPLIRAFNWPEIKTRVSVDGVISVIDGPAYAAGLFAHDPVAVDAQRAADENLSHETPLSEVFEDQLMAADMVLLNKADQLSSGEVTELTARLEKKLKNGVHVVAAHYGNVAVDVLLGLNAAAEDDLDSRHSHHENEDGEPHDHDHDDFESFVVDLGPVSDPAALEAGLIQLASDFNVLRIKGFVDVPGKTARHVVQGVGTRFTRYFDRAWGAGELRQSRLVVIGETGLDQSAITQTISKLADAPLAEEAKSESAA